MLEQILSHVSPSNALIALVVGALFYTAITRIQENRKIRSLGYRAPTRTAYLPFSLDFIYDAVQHLLAHRNYEFWLKSFTKYGNPSNPWTLELRAGGRRVVLTADPDNIKAMLATQFKEYGKGEPFNREWHEFLGDSIFTTDGEMWHNSRQLLRPQFIKDRVSDLEIFEKHFNVLVAKIGGAGQEVDVADLFFRYTLDAATDFLLGRSVNSLENPQVEFAEAFTTAQHVQSLISRTGGLNWLIPRRKFRASLKVINEFLNPYIEQTLRLSPEELEKRSSSDSGYTFLHALAGHTRDRQVLRDQLMAILLAGRDTTASTLSWLFYELSNRPKIVAKLRDEIVSVVGLHRQPTYEHIKNMRYLQHTLNETLRLYPVVPFNVRMSVADTTLPRGGGPDGNMPVGVPKDTPVGYSTLVMQRREDLYPPAASGFPPVADFVPERWDHWTPKSWTYIPFNGGPRICIGQQFALTEMAYTVIRLLQRFERIESRMQGRVPGLMSDIVLQPACPVRVAFWEGRWEKSGML